jgi:hypothetical protein
VADSGPRPVTRKDGTPSLDARGYSWPPFEPGHTLSMRHGAYSPRVVAQVADELGPDLDGYVSEHAPWAADKRFALTRRNLAETMALKVLALRGIAEMVDEKGPGAVPNRRIETALAALRAERDALEALGLSPLGEAHLRSLVADTAVTEKGLADLVAEGRQIIEQRQTDAAAEVTP